jgi:hypothetical protein
MSIVDTKSVGPKQERILRELVLALTQMLVNYKTNDDVDEDILLKQENEITEEELIDATKRRLRLAVRLRYDEKRIIKKGIRMLREMLSNFDDDSSSDDDDVGDINIDE